MSIGNIRLFDAIILGALLAVSGCSNVPDTFSSDNPYTYTVSISGDYGTLSKSPDRAYYRSGDTVRVRAYPDSAFFFGSWTGDTVGGSMIDADDSGVITVVVSGDLDIRALFIPAHFTVTYNGNGNTEGLPPAPITDSTIGSSVRVTGNPDSLKRAGYQFIGWNTLPDGSGDRLIEGTKITVPDSDVTLYAQWAPLVFGLNDTMVLIPGGTFRMGDKTRTLNADSWRLHTVTVSSFYMTTSLCTQVEFLRVMTEFKSSLGNGRYWSRYIENDSCALNLYWGDVVLYCNARSKREGLDSVYSYSSVFVTRSGTDFDSFVKDHSKNGYRLPTEAEWEYAARAGSTSLYYWGNDPAGCPRINQFGLKAMGDVPVSAFCEDWYNAYPAESQTNPIGPETSKDGDFPRVVVRGYAGGDGSFTPTAERWSVYYNEFIPSYVAFRVVRRYQ